MNIHVHMVTTYLYSLFPLNKSLLKRDFTKACRQEGYDVFGITQKVYTFTLKYYKPTHI